jgi:hypothetical protein
VIVIVVVVVMVFRSHREFGRGQRFALRAFHRRLLGSLQFRSFALDGFALAHAPVILPRIENQMQPWHHLFDRRQLAGRTGLAARAGRARHARLALRPDFTHFSLRTRFAAFALGTGYAGFSLRTRFATLALRTGGAGLSIRARLAALALQAGFARRTGFAARTFRPWSARMPLRSGTAWLAGSAARALGSLPSLPGRCVVGHVLTPNDSAGDFCNRDFVTI